MTTATLEIYERHNDLVTLCRQSNRLRNMRGFFVIQGERVASVKQRVLGHHATTGGPSVTHWFLFGSAIPVYLTTTASLTG